MLIKKNLCLRRNSSQIEGGEYTYKSTSRESKWYRKNFEFDGNIKTIGTRMLLLQSDAMIGTAVLLWLEPAGSSS